MMSIEITELNIYPVKGLRACRLTEACLQPTGLQWDRHWMIVMPNGRMVTQRQMPALARIATAIDDDALTLSADGHEPISISLTLDASAQASTSGDHLIEVSIWKDVFAAQPEVSAANEWINQVLQPKFPLRLVRMAQGQPRPQSHPDELGAETTTQFADAAPFLLTNEASLSQLNDVLQTNSLDPVPMNRFRPNIVVRGLPAFAEYCEQCLTDTERTYSIALRYPSQRCIVTTIDQHLGVKHPDGEPLNTLRKMKTVAEEEGAFFGQNATLLQGENQLIRVGDRLSWLQ